MWQYIEENPRAVAYAVAMHLVLLVLLVVSLDWSPAPKRAGAPQAIKAELVSNDVLKKAERKKQEDRRRAELEKKKRLEAEQRKKAEAEQKQRAAAEKKKKAEQEAKRRAEAEKQRKLALEKKKKAEAEKKRREEVERKKRAEAENKKQAEAEAKRKAEEQRRRQEEAQRLKAEQDRIAAEQEAAAQGVVTEYTGYIRDKVERNWLRPPGSPPGLSCTVQVRLIPGGDVADVRITRSSGDAVFDRSVEAAVFRAAPLPVPPDAALFNRFRQIDFIFNPG